VPSSRALYSEISKRSEATVILFPLNTLGQTDAAGSCMEHGRAATVLVAAPGAGFDAFAAGRADPSPIISGTNAMLSGTPVGPDEGAAPITDLPARRAVLASDRRHRSPESALGRYRGFLGH
ncbi:hypothetical protein, partial [Mesorhizobium sp. M1136]|uniref:hypothetical protein n=1 Tax=Mesorhizobium sp. M1136 TaxID=2957059 RepID=UPI00333DFC03